MLFAAVLNAKQGNSMYHFFQVFGVTRPGIVPQPTDYKAIILPLGQEPHSCIHSFIIRCFDIYNFISFIDSITNCSHAHLLFYLTSSAGRFICL